MTALAVRRPHLPFGLVTAGALAAWTIAWFALASAVHWLTADVLGLNTTAGAGAAIEFFLFDLPKVLLLLIGVVTAVSFLRSFVSPDRVRHALAGRNVVAGSAAAAGFGVVTPSWSRMSTRCGSGAVIEMRLSMEQRVRDAWLSTRQLVRRIAPWIVIGIAIGALIHGYAPMELVAQVGGASNPFAVPLVVLLGVPLYSNAAGVILIVEALLGKGLPLGTVLAFMMAVTALSLPELLILRRVMRRELIVVFVAVVAAGILGVGYLFNLLAS